MASIILLDAFGIARLIFSLSAFVRIAIVKIPMCYRLGLSYQSVVCIGSVECETIKRTLEQTGVGVGENGVIYRKLSNCLHFLIWFIQFNFIVQSHWSMGIARLVGDFIDQYRGTN